MIHPHFNFSGIFMEVFMRIKNIIHIAIAFWIGCILILSGRINVSAAGALTMAVSSGSVSAGDTMTVTVYVKNAQGQEATSDLTISYDSSKLEYVSATGGGASGGGGTVKASGSEVQVKFKAISSGDAYVKAEGVAVTAAGAHVMVSGNASSGANTTDEAADEDSVNTAGSGDNSLSSLSLSTGTLSPSFKGSVTSYTASVGSDVSDIDVTAVTSNSKAKVESVTGNKGLSEGENVIAVTVVAENGTKAVYRITVTKGKTAGGDNAGTGENPDTPGEEAAQGDNNEAKSTGTSDGTGSGDPNSIEIDGVIYHIVDDFPEDSIPPGFSPGNFEYKGEKHRGLTYEHGHMGLYYLANEAGEGAFFVYDADRDGFYPYIRLTSGEHFIIPIVVPNGAIPPNDYMATTLVIGDVSIPAYQYHGKDVEIVNLEDTEVPEGSTGSDFYLFYAMDGEGVAGWYQYDKVQGTYQRLNAETATDNEDAASYDTLLESYNDLNSRYKDMKTKNRRVVAVLIFLTVILLIVVINLVLRDRGEDDYYDEDEEDTARPGKAKKGHKKRNTITRDHDGTDDDKINNSARNRNAKSGSMKNSNPGGGFETHTAKQAAVEKTVAGSDDSDEYDDFYDGDSNDIMAEFEDEPSITGGRGFFRKKEKPVRQSKERGKRESKRAESSSEDLEEDDDIEFLDLND